VVVGAERKSREDADPANRGRTRARGLVKYRKRRGRHLGEYVSCK